jgi:hypothetical protein
MSALLVDQLHQLGELSDEARRATYLFRDDWQSLVRARSKARRHKEQRQGSGRRDVDRFNMQAIAVERALKVERALTPECFAWALILIGEHEGELEANQARRACWELVEVYGRNRGLPRQHFPVR